MILACSPEFRLNVLSIGIFGKLAMLVMTHRVGHVWSQGHNFSIFKCHLPDDATYQLTGL